MDKESFYAHLRREIEVDYGRKRDRYTYLFKDLHSDVMDTFAELLQNADDCGSSEFGIEVSESGLLVWNNGRVFSDDDVRGVCGIGQTTKEAEPVVGLFGLGFKTVFAWTTEPHIASGEHSLVIRDYLDPWPAQDVPTSVSKLAQDGKTVFWLPYRQELKAARLQTRIARHIEQLSITLLFLSHVTDLTLHMKGHTWQASRQSHQCSSRLENARLTTGSGDTQWLVWSKWGTPPPRAVGTLPGRFAERFSKRQRVSLAFRLDSRGKNLVRETSGRAIYAYLPTHETAASLGFLVQAPFSTSLSRELLDWQKPWNRWLVRLLAGLANDIPSSLREARPDLVSSFLGVLPVEDDGPYPEALKPITGSLWTAVRDDTGMVPSASGDFVAPAHARIPGAGIRELISAETLQLMQGCPVDWVSPSMMEGRRRHALQAIGVKEFGVDDLLAGLRQLCDRWPEWLSRQSPEWLVGLYRYLARARANRAAVDGIAMVRTNRGMSRPDQPVFLPLDEELKAEFEEALPFLAFLDDSICERLHEEARTFLEQVVGVAELTAVNFAKTYVRQRFRAPADLPAQECVAVIRTLFDCYRRQSDAIFLKALRSLSDCPCLLVAEEGGEEGGHRLASPSECYLGEEYTRDASLQIYFIELQPTMVSPVYLRGNETPEDLAAWTTFLETLGASAVPRFVHIQAYEYEERFRRVLAECRVLPEKSTRLALLDDITLDGLQAALDRARQDPAAASSIASLVSQVYRTSRAQDREGRYEWHYYSWQAKGFPAEWVRLLRTTPWIMASDGSRHVPSSLWHPDLKSVYGPDIPYLSPGIAKYAEPEFWRWLGVNVDANCDSILKKLTELRDADHANPLKDATSLYELLDTHTADDPEISAQLSSKALILTRTGDVCSWVSPGDTWWEAPDGFPPGLASLYPNTLRDFFLRQGVPEYPMPVQLVSWLLRLTDAESSQLEALEPTIVDVYLRLLDAWRKGVLPEAEELHNKRIWLGKKGSQYRLCESHELVWVDRVSGSPESASGLWVWASRGTEELATLLNLPKLSEGRLVPYPGGEQELLREATAELRKMVPLINWFIGPEGLQVVAEVHVRAAQTLSAMLHVGETAVGPKPISCCSDGRAVWVSTERKDWIGDAIGEALELYSGAHNLREFTKDLWQASKESREQRTLLWSNRLGRFAGDLLTSLAEPDPTARSEVPSSQTGLPEPVGLLSKPHAERAEAPVESLPDQSSTATGTAGGRGSRASGLLPSPGRRRTWRLQRGGWKIGVRRTIEARSATNATAASRKLEIARVGLEAVLDYEIRAGRTPEEMEPNHPGYDVVSRDSTGKIARYIEVKTTEGTWEGDHEVPLTPTQLRIAQELGSSYWLYVVEVRTSSETPTITCIADLAGKAMLFAFGAEWRAAAEETAVCAENPFHGEYRGLP